MASKIKVDQIEGSSGSTVTIPSGQTFTVTDGLTGSGASLTALNASNIASGSLDNDRLSTVSVAKGGTNLTSFAAGDLLYATGATTLAKLTKPASTMNLQMTSGGVPSWVEAAGGGVLQVKQMVYDASLSLSSETYAQVNASFALAITPTDANSKFLLQATMYSSGADHDGAIAFNWFDSQVGTAAADVLFTDSTEGASRTAAFQTGTMAFNNDTSADNYAGYQSTLYNMYTPSTQNTTERTFSIAYKTNGAYTSNFNVGQTNSAPSWGTVSSITIFEISSSVY